MNELITYIYSDGDTFMAQCKLIVIYMFLQFGLMLMDVVSTGLRSV